MKLPQRAFLGNLLGAASLAALATMLPASALGAAAATDALELGLDVGAPFNDRRDPLFLQDLHAVLKASGTKVVRLHFVHGGFGDDRRLFFERYDGLIRGFTKRGIRILGLITNETVPGTPDQWNANSYEAGQGNGANAYLDKLSDTFAFIASSWRDVVKRYEIWNEPNAPATSIHPSNLSYLLATCYAKLRWSGVADVRLTSGGIFAHNLQGYTWSGSGADYLDRLYATGLHATGQLQWVRSRFGTDPIDEVGTNLYVCQGGDMQGKDVYGIACYLDNLQKVIGTYDIGAKVRVTETGWTVAPGGPSAEDQAGNLVNVASLCGQRSDVSGLMYYKLMDGLGDATWGLLSAPSYAPRTSFYAWAQMNGVDVNALANPTIDWS